MTRERLGEFIAAGETLDVEFKGEDARALSDSDLVESVVCLANRPGDDSGWLVVGVEDDGRITGARPRHGAATDPLRLQALVSNRTRPSITPRVEVLDLNGKPIIVVEVPAARSPVGTSDGKYVRRTLGGDSKPACLPFSFHEMQAQQADRGVLDYSALTVEGVRWDDLDPIEIERFRRVVREGSGRGDTSLLDLPDIELAKALGAVEANHKVRAVRMLGILLFGREDVIRRVLPTHEVAFQVLSGVNVQANDFFRWPLLRTMEELEARFRARNREEELIAGLLRIGVPDYSPRAFREAVANSLIHRDYSRLGAVHVQWHADRLELSNPGGLPEGVRLDNLLVTPPRPRNPLLADAFKRAGIVERTARGIDTIFFEQLRNGRPAPSYARSTQASVVLVLPGGDANLDFVRLVVEENQAGRLLALDDLLILNAMWLERRLTAAEAARLIQKPEADARVRLGSLVESGLVEARGERASRAYLLSAATYRRLGDKAGYVRQRGFEPEQQEQMVLQFARKHGRITRGETADLCQISSLQARYLLNRLVQKDLLSMHGIKRGTYYGPSSITMDKSKTVLDRSKKIGRRPKRR
jgi:ATP-dependent DNA helicase RecG